MIKFQNVSKKFGSTLALQDISFEVQPGEFVFITGPSGSGKTTLVRLLNGELSIDGGEITLGETDISKLKKHQIPQLRQSLGIVFQDFKLIPNLTIFENVAVALRVRNVSSSQIHHRVHELLQQVGLEHRHDVFPSQMAGGELQRACLARAVVGNPTVILADEPTGNLDPATSWQIMQLFEQINQQGNTILMSTHNMDIVNSMKKRVIHLDHGKLVSDNTTGQYTT